MCDAPAGIWGGGRHPMGWDKRRRVGLIAIAVSLLLACVLARGALAYTAAGDRLFPATILLPQISPGDEFYTNVMTLPQTPSGIGTPNRNTTFSEVYAKTITDRFGIFVEEDYTRLDRVKAGTLSGWQNLAVSARSEERR